MGGRGERVGGSRPVPGGQGLGGGAGVSGLVKELGPHPFLEDPRRRVAPRRPRSSRRSRCAVRRGGRARRRGGGRGRRTPAVRRRAVRRPPSATVRAARPGGWADSGRWGRSGTVPAGARTTDKPPHRGAGTSSRLRFRLRGRQLRVPLRPGIHPPTDATGITAVHSGDLGSTASAAGCGDLLIRQKSGCLFRRASGLDRGALRTGHHGADLTCGSLTVLETGPHRGHSQDPSGPCWAAPPQFGQFTVDHHLHALSADPASSPPSRPRQRVAGQSWRAARAALRRCAPRSRVRASSGATSRAAVT